MQFYVYISIGIVVGSLSGKIQFSEIKYRELFNHSGNAACLADMKSGTIVEVNAKFRETFGLAGENFPEDIFQRAFPDKDAVAAINARLAGGDAVTDMDISITPEKGVSENFVLSATPLDAEGLTVITLSDVSRIKREDAVALAESEAKYRSLVELAQEGIWAIDAEGITTYVNPKLVEILGYTREEMLKHSLFEFLGEKSWIGAPPGPESGKEGARRGRV